jgi:hypothetical protein
VKVFVIDGRGRSLSIRQELLSGSRSRSRSRSRRGISLKKLLESFVQFKTQALFERPLDRRIDHYLNRI